MLDKRNKKLEEAIKLANTSEEDLEKMNYKEKQKVFKAKSSLYKIVWDSSKGTYKKANEVGVNVNDRYNK